MSDAPKRRPWQRVVVLDPGLKDTRTHHHVLNRNLATRAAALGIPLDVIAHRRARENDFAYRAIPTFMRGVYEDTPAIDDTSFAMLVTDHAQDISRVLGAAGPVAIVMHTVTAAGLCGLAAALAGGGHDVKALAVQFMFHPLSFSTNGGEAPRSMARYAAAIRSLRQVGDERGVRIHLSTSCAEFADVFTGLGAGRVDLHPYALLAEAERPRWSAQRLAVSAPMSSGRPRVLLYGGDPKLDKGLGWVADALPTLLEEQPDVEFVVHFGDNRFADPTLDTLRQRVLRIVTRERNLRILEGHVAPADWDTLFESVDFLLIPYDPRAYRWKTSGVFWEALLKCHANAMIVVTKNTWMEREVRAAGLDVQAVGWGDTPMLGEMIRRMNRSPRVITSACRHQLPCFARGNDDYLLTALADFYGAGIPAR